MTEAEITALIPGAGPPPTNIAKTPFAGIRATLIDPVDPGNPAIDEQNSSLIVFTESGY
jgi:hypothetical protein